MSTRTILLTPIDAWFFRDGRPYNQGESGQTDVRSLFPPFAPTVVGTLRAALAVGQGWNGRESWANELHPILGNGFDDLGQLQFHGPFLVRDGKCLFPVPLHLRVAECPEKHEGDDAPIWLPSALMTPAPESAALECDIGKVRFPIAVQKSTNLSSRDPIDLWVTVDGYEQILRGLKPGSGILVHSKKLWAIEQRVGLERNHDSRAVEVGKLYSPQYVRLLKGVGLASVIEGIPTNWKKFPDLLAFGGESRMAYCEPIENELPPESPVDMIRASNRFTVSLLTPLCLPIDPSGRLSLPLPGECFPGVAGATIVSACVGKPVQIGGWNSLKREPLPLIPYLPAGSTWFCEADPAALDSILSLHGHHVGERTPYGFGQIALGAWPQETGDIA